MNEYPKVYNENKVGEYPALANSGGGYVWDEVLEYRVWCHPEQGAKDLENGNDYYYAFSNYDDAYSFATNNEGTEEPLALILQREYIDEPEPGIYIHKQEERITEWPVQFLTRPKRDEKTLPNFFAPNAPNNRLDIIRGLKEGETYEQVEIFISEINDQINKALVIDGDQHTVWAYCMEMINDEQELLFNGFLCSRGTIVNKSEDVKRYIGNDLQPPLLETYTNEYSIHNSIVNSDFQIEWKSEVVKVYINQTLYLIMDMKNRISYSKSINQEGPYGIPISKYMNE